VPLGVYVDRGGARMRAVFKFPTLAQAVADRDGIRRVKGHREMPQLIAALEATIKCESLDTTARIA